MSDPSADFTISLKDDTSATAEAAASSLEDLQKTIDDDVKALRQMQRAMRNLKASTSTGSSAFKELRDQISAQKAGIGRSQSQFIQLGGTFGKTGGKAQGLATGLQSLGGTAAKAGGPIGALGGGLARLGGFLANPIGAALALAAALLAVGAAAVVATGALLRFGLAQSGARRSEALQIEGLNTLRHQYGRTTASVEAMQAAIDRASDSTNIGRGTLAGYARQLSRAGLRGEALASSVEAMGIAAQVQGDRGAARFRAMAINARLTGQSVEAVAESFRRRLGPIARRQMLSIDNQTQRLRRSLERIFGGLRIEAFLGSVEQMTSLFSQSTASGRALKGIVEALLQPLIDSFAVVGPVARRFFQGMVIAALLVTIGIQRVGNALQEAFGGSELTANIDVLNLALWAGGIFMGVLVVAALALGAAFVFVAVWAGLIVAAMVAVPVALMAVAFGIGAAIAAAVDFVRRIDARAMANNLISGLVQGLTSGAARVATAVRGLASSAATAFQSALDMRSPSRVFAEFGANISAGVVQGVDAGSSDVDHAIGDLVDVPEGGGRSGGVSISIGDITIDAGGTSDPRELALAFRDELANILSGLSIEMGAT